MKLSTIQTITQKSNLLSYTTYDSSIHLITVFIIIIIIIIIIITIIVIVIVTFIIIAIVIVIVIVIVIAVVIIITINYLFIYVFIYLLIMVAILLVMQAGCFLSSISRLYFHQQLSSPWTLYYGFLSFQQKHSCIRVIC